MSFTPAWVEAVVAQWIRQWTLNHEVPGLNLLTAAVVLLGKAFHPYCQVFQKGPKAIGTLDAYKQLANSTLDAYKHAAC